MRPIDADALEKEGWSMHRTIRVDMNTFEYQTKPLKQVLTIEPEDKCNKCDAWNQYKNYPHICDYHIDLKNIAYQLSKIADALKEKERYDL